MNARALDWVATAILLLLGAGHTVLTAKFAPGMDEATLWFSGAGLALLFAGILNLCRLSAPEARRVRQLCFLTNLLTLAWLALIIYVITVPQAYLAAAAALATTVLSASPRGAGHKLETA